MVPCCFDTLYHQLNVQRTNSVPSELHEDRDVQPSVNELSCHHRVCNSSNNLCQYKRTHCICLIALDFVAKVTEKV